MESGSGRRRRRPAIPSISGHFEPSTAARPHKEPMGSNDRITPKNRDYSVEPPSHWTSHSHGNPALRASNVAADEVRPLSRFGGPVYRVLDPTIQTPGSARLRDSDDRETSFVSQDENSASGRVSHPRGCYGCRNWSACSFQRFVPGEISVARPCDPSNARALASPFDIRFLEHPRRTPDIRLPSPSRSPTPATHGEPSVKPADLHVSLSHGR